jgi:hypothetical protein
VTRVGTTSTSDPQLAADPDGTRFGWVDPSGDTLSFDVVNQETGQVRRTSGATAASERPTGDVGGRIIAIDGLSAYWQDGDDTWETYLGDDGQTTQGVAVPLGWQLFTALDGWTVQQNLRTGDVTVGRINEPGVELPGALGGGAALSPDHRWVSLFTSMISTAQPQVYDVRTGEPVELDLEATFALGYEWLDDDTLVVLTAANPDADYSLMTCTVPDGACSVAVADLGEAPGERNPTGFAIPIGEPYYPDPHG